MLRDTILGLFQDCEPEVQQILANVITLEWEKLSYKNPQLKNEIRQIIEDAIKEAQS